MSARESANACDYLTGADVLARHAILVRRYGGTGGVRGPGALEAALFHPQTGYYRDIIAEAAAPMESLTINHPFVDGNKRIAFAAVDVFLRIDGWPLRRKPASVFAQMMRMLDEGTFDVPRLEPWLSRFARAGVAACGDRRAISTPRSRHTWRPSMPGLSRTQRRLAPRAPQRRPTVSSTHRRTAASSPMSPSKTIAGTWGSLSPRGRPSHTLRGTCTTTCGAMRK